MFAITRATSVLSVLSFAAGAALPFTAASAATLRTVSSASQRPSVSGSIITYKGLRIRIGWAARKLQALRRSLPNVFTLPAQPLYVADPGLNAVVIFNGVGLGVQTPSAVLSGPNTQLNGPVGIVGSYDVPCTANTPPSRTTCANYLWVANAGNDTITVYGTGAIGAPPLVSPNQTPNNVISNPSTCTPSGMGFPGGIGHVGPLPSAGYASFNPGYVVEPDESGPSIQLYNALFNGQECALTYETTNLVTPSGLSGEAKLLPHLYAELFNANNDTVTQSYYNDSPVGNGTWTPSSNIWTVGNPGTGNPGASTQGTALDRSMPGGGYLWVTTAARISPPWNFDAVWLCRLNTFALLTGNPNACPATPAITGPSLSYPVFPKVSAARSLLYVPNMTNGTVTDYKETGAFPLHATFINLASPWDVAGVDT